MITEKQRERQKKYREEHRERIREYDKLYYSRKKADKLDYYARHREERKAYRRNKSRRHREIALNHYGNKCACCGESSYEFLAIDHINGDGKSHRKHISGGKRQSGNEICSWLIKNNFPDGFRILCHNCNQSIGFYGYCPHQKESL